MATRPAPDGSGAHATDGGPDGLLVVSDVRLLRDGITRLIAELSPSIVVGGASLAAAPAALRRHPPSVVLLDLSSPDALAVARALLLGEPGTRIVAFALTERDADVIECAEAGIVGYVPREGSAADLLAAAERAREGELLCTPRTAALLFRRLAALAALHSDDSRATALSPREREITALIEQGLSNKQIAHTLHIEVATVKNHVHHILEKLQVQRRGEAAARVRDRGGEARGTSIRD